MELQADLDRVVAYLDMLNNHRLIKGKYRLCVRPVADNKRMEIVSQSALYPNMNQVISDDLFKLLKTSCNRIERVRDYDELRFTSAEFESIITALYRKKVIDEILISLE